MSLSLLRGKWRNAQDRPDCCSAQLAVGLHNAAAQQSEVVGKANFYAQTSDVSARRHLKGDIFRRGAPFQIFGVRYFLLIFDIESV